VRTIGEIVGYGLNYDERFQIEKLFQQISQKSHEEVIFLSKLKGSDFDYFIFVGRN